MIVSFVTMTVVIMTTWSVIVTSMGDFMASENSHLDDVENQAGNCGYKHNILLDGRGVKKSIVSGEEEPDGNGPEESKREDSTDNFSAVVTEGH